MPTDGEDPTLSMWSDRYFTAWPPGFKAADAFLAMNAARVERAYDAHPSSRSATSSRGAI